MTQVQDSTHPTGVSTVDEDDRGGSALARARDRKANAALQLRMAGAQWDEIAETLGYPTARAALVATERALEKEARAPETQALMREMISRRYERMTRSFFSRAINEQHPEQFTAAEMVRKLTGDYVKINGLAAPTEFVVHNPTQAEVEAWIAQVTTSGVTDIEEGDIFDVEVVEDEEAPGALPAE